MLAVVHQLRWRRMELRWRRMELRWRRMELRWRRAYISIGHTLATLAARVIRAHSPRRRYGHAS
jgi:hypothetical protein